MKNIDHNLILKALNSGKVFSVNYYSDGKLLYRFDFIKSNEVLFYTSHEYASDSQDDRGKRIYEYSKSKPGETFECILSSLLDAYYKNSPYEHEFFIQKEEDVCYIEKAFALKELETL